MKKLVILALVVSTSAVFAQKKDDPKAMEKKPPMMMDDKSMPMHDMMMMDDKAPKKGKKGDKGMRGGMMMEMSPSDEATMKKDMMDRGMTAADATKMIQLRKEMFAIMKKYMDKAPMPPAGATPPAPAPKKP